MGAPMDEVASQVWVIRSAAPAETGSLRFRGHREESGGGKMLQNEEQSFLQGLKPIESPRFTSALKHRPPEEKDLFRSLRSVCATKGAWPI
jgi:hypothetical protein